MSHTCHRRVVSPVLLIPALLTPLLVYGLSSSGDLRINIAADDGVAVIDEGTQTSVYRGNVTIDQGTMRLAADEVKYTTSDSDSREEIVATTDPKSSRNVTVNDGTMRIMADQVKITLAHGEIVEFVASTDPKSSRLAHFQQQDTEQDAVSAYAREILYVVRDEILQLSGNARLQHTADVFSGELLKYDVRNGTFALQGHRPSDKDASGRISISLTPTKK